MPFHPTAPLPDDGAPKGISCVPGDVIDGRFEIEKRLGVGAMGVVYRALDRHAGEAIALKILHQASAKSGRFAREAAVLADLRHPAIVRYIAHGTTAGGSQFLVMELLEGKTLSERLDGKPLPLGETLALGRRVAEALALAHERGIVHRDIKPSNLFLENGELERVKVLDFGIARPMHDQDGLTHTGSMVGTPGYMAPEQVRGSRAIDARTDLFALGCVLFECFTGSPAFYAHDMLALLSRILFDEPRPVRETSPGVPAAVDTLVARMLCKEPDGRPESAASVARVLGGRDADAEIVDIEQTVADATPPSLAPAITDSELRILSVVVAARALSDAIPESKPDVTTGPLADDADPKLLALRKIAEPFGARLEGLIDGSVVATVAGRGSATDRAAQAARCALAMRRLLPESPMSLATGRGDVSERLPIGEAIDRAALLARASAKAQREAGARSTKGGSIATIRIDSVTAGLLDARFEVGGETAAHVLHGERETGEPVRTLLGKATPCVGRETELATLAAAVRACVAERSARAVLLTGPAGVGKSRLAYELVRTLRQASDPPQPGPAGDTPHPETTAPSRRPRFEAWHARGEPLRVGSPFGLLAQVVKRAAGVGDAESLFMRQHKLRARVERCIRGPEAQRVTEFLGELCGTPFAEEQSVQLRAARKDPILMGDQIRRAWEDWVRAECVIAPVLIIIEDLHWGDLPTVKSLDAALRNLTESPLLILALARPEVRELFPSLWADRPVQELALTELSGDAVETLVREVLGDEVPVRTLAWVALHCQGNALYLEELIRTVAEGRAGALPGTVLAMMQARLEALEPETRRVLRAASVFGELFSDDGVRALLGGADRVPDLDARLGELVRRELLIRRTVTVPGGAPEYVFRHALVQEAAYESLTEADRTLGHHLAAEWLEQAGASEAVLLAKHFERAGEPGRAARWYARAAEQALEGNDLPAVIQRAERAIDCGASAEMLGQLRLLQAEAHRWRGETDKTVTRAQQAMDALAKGSPLWFLAAAEMAIASSRLGQHDHVRAIANALEGALLRTDTDRAIVLAAAQMAIHLIVVGRAERGAQLYERLEAAASRFLPGDPVIAARIEIVRGWRAVHAGDSGAHLGHMMRSVEFLALTGDIRNECKERVNLGFAYNELGQFEAAETPLCEAMATADRMGIGAVVATARQNLAVALARQGRLEEARGVAEDALAAFRAQGNRRMQAATAISLATILKLAGDLDGADRSARMAVEVGGAPPDRCQALASLAEILLARRSYVEALDAAQGAIQLLESLGGIDEGEALVRLVYAQALGATGHQSAAQDAVVAARDRLLERASKIQDPALRASFLERVPDNAATLELAGKMLAPKT